MSSPEILERFAGLRRHLVPVPAAQSGICPVCRTGLTDHHSYCYHCQFHTHLSVLPISISRAGGPIHDRLNKYKRSLDGDVRKTFLVDLATIVSVFLDHHLPCLGGDFDLIAMPPSTQQKQGVQEIIGLFRRRFPGNVNPLVWNDPVARTFSVDPNVEGKRVLLFDDTFTTGRRAVFPAAGALQAAGAQIRGPLVVGRHFNPGYGENGAIWNQLARADYDPTKCARCDGYRLDPPLRPPEQSLFDSDS